MINFSRLHFSCNYFSVLTITLMILLVISGCSVRQAKQDKADKPDKAGEPSEYQSPVIKEKTKQKDSGYIVPTQRPYVIYGIKYYPIASSKGYVQTGIASWYGEKFHGRKTSNGETYNMYDMTAAHKTLPMNTWVLVKNLENDREITVRINDRGPFVSGRIIDLSYTGAQKIGILGPGTGKVRITALGEALNFSGDSSGKNDSPTSFKFMNYETGNFTLQVGAFKTLANAEKYRDKLGMTYPNVHIQNYTDERGTFYRVRLGSFTSLKDAEMFSDKLISQNKFITVFVVAE
jgi:rare lipoprotein A